MAQLNEDNYLTGGNLNEEGRKAGLTDDDVLGGHLTAEGKARLAEQSESAKAQLEQEIRDRGVAPEGFDASVQAATQPPNTPIAPHTIGVPVPREDEPAPPEGGPPADRANVVEGDNQMGTEPEETPEETVANAAAEGESQAESAEPEAPSDEGNAQGEQTNEGEAQRSGW